MTMGGPVERPVPTTRSRSTTPTDVARADDRHRQRDRAGRTADSAVGIERTGMFGVAGTGDTSGFGGLVREPWTPPAAAAPVRRLLRRGRRRARRRPTRPFDDAIEKVVVDRGELTLHIDARAPARSRRRRCATTPALRFELCSTVSGVDYLGVGEPAARRSTT